MGRQMSLRRAIARASEVTLPLRKTSKKDQTRLGVYPVPPEAYQQKIMWQWFWGAPSRWYWRYSKWAWPIGVPCLIMYVFVYKSCEADVEADIRAKAWW